MARRKRQRKVNRTVVVVLSVIGAVFVLGGAVAVYRWWPKDPYKYEKLAEEAVARGDYKEAESLYRFAIEGAEDHGDYDLYCDYCIRYSEVMLEWLAEKRNEMMQSEREKVSQRVYDGLRTALRAQPRHVEALWRLSNLYWESWLRNNRQANPTPLLETTSYLLESDANDRYRAVASYRRGMAARPEAKRLAGPLRDQVIEDLARAVALDPNSAEYRVGLGQTLHEFGLYDRADKVFAQAKADLPDLASIPATYAVCLAEQDRHAEAREQFQLARQVDPDDLRTCMVFASYLTRNQQLDLALEVLDDARRLAPSNLQVYLLSADVHRARRAPRQAMAMYRQALDALDKLYRDVDPNLPSVQQQRMEEDYLNRKGAVHGRLAEVLMDLAAGEQDANARRQLYAQAEDSLSTMADSAGEDSPAFHALRGRLALREGQFGTAIDHLQKAWDGTRAQGQGRVDLRTGLSLAGLYIETRRPGRAEEIVKVLETTDRFGRHPLVRLIRARIELRRGNASAALGALEGAEGLTSDGRKLYETAKVVARDTPIPDTLQIDREVKSILLQEAERFWAEDRRQRAVRLLEQLHEREPADLQIVQQLGRRYAQLDQKDKALALLDEAARLHPDNPRLARERDLLTIDDPDEKFRLRMEALDEEIDEPFDLLIAKARLAGIHGKDDLNLSLLKQAGEMALRDENIGRLRLAVEMIFTAGAKAKDWALVEKWIEIAGEKNVDRADGATLRARLLLLRGRYDEAIDVLRGIVAKHPDATEHWSLLGAAYRQVGRTEEARDALLEALKIDPAYPKALIEMARLTEFADRQEHEVWVEKAATVAPSHPYIQSRVLATQEDTSDPQRMIRRRERLFQRNPDDASNVMALARLYEQVGRVEDAEKMLQRVYDRIKDKDKVAATNILAPFYARQGRMKEVEDMINDLARNEDNRVPAYMLYAQILAPRDPDRALGYLATASEEYPDDPNPHRFRAHLLLRRSRPDEAIEAMRTYVRLAGSTPASRKEFVRVLLDAGKVDEAIEAIETILSQTPRDAEALSLRGAAFHTKAMRIEDEVEREELFARAEKDYSQAISLAPTSTRPLARRSMLYEQTGRLKSAIDDLEEARRLVPTRAVEFRLASLYHRAGNSVRAESTYRRLLERNPNDMAAQQALLDLLFERNNPHQLRTYIDEMKTQYPNDASPYLAEAEFAKTTGNDALRVAALDQAMAREPNDLSVISHYVRGLIETSNYSNALTYLESRRLPAELQLFGAIARGACLAGLGRDRDADGLFRQIVPRLTTGSMPVFTDLVSKGYGRVPAAERLEDWASLRPNDPLILAQAGRLYQQAGELDKALPPLRKAITRAKPGTPLWGSLHSSLGQVQQAAGRDRHAEEAYLKAIEVNPDDFTTLNNLAYLYVDALDEPEKAIPYAKEATRLRPDDTNIADTWGWVLAKAGRLDEAARVFERITARRDATAEMVYHMGWVYERLERYTEATRQYDKAETMLAGAVNSPLARKVQAAQQRVRQARSGR
jgi:tetratricopeptide (TPR) repeat protein